MKNAIFNNAYGVLGLLPNATQKELSRRVKELDKLLQIGEVPSYDYDFDTFKNLRNEKGIKAANDELASISRQILHSFFRVYVSSEIHANALQRLAQSGEGIRDFYNSKDSWDFISKKNFAIAATLYMCEYTTEDFALSLWDELLNARAHLKTFQKLFLSDDELSVSESHFEGLKERLIIELSRVFKEVADETSEQSILASFIKKFGTQNLDENIGKEGFDELKKALAILEKLDISADGVYDDEEKATIKKCLKMFENGFEKLKNLGLYDSSKALQIRDLAIKKIRAQSLDLHNNLSQSEESLKLTEFAMKISGSQSTKNQLEQDFAALKQQIKGKEHQELMNEAVMIMKDIESLENNFNSYKLGLIKQKISALKAKDKEKCLLKKVENNYGQRLDVYDAFAMKLRGIAIDLCNVSSRYSEARELLNYALQIANSSNIESRIRKDISDLNNVTKPYALYTSSSSNDDVGNKIKTIIEMIIFWIFLFFILKACDG